MPVVCLDIQILFDQYNFENGCDIAEVQGSDLSMVENTKARQDCIQISTIDYIIMWDIEN